LCYIFHSGIVETIDLFRLVFCLSKKDSFNSSKLKKKIEMFFRQALNNIARRGLLSRVSVPTGKYVAYATVATAAAAAAAIVSTDQFEWQDFSLADVKLERRVWALESDAGLKGSQRGIASDLDEASSLTVLHVKTDSKRIAQVLQAALSAQRVAAELSLQCGESVDVVVGFSAKYWNKIGLLFGSAAVIDAECTTKKCKLGAVPHSGGEIVIHVRGASQSVVRQVVAHVVAVLDDDNVKSVDDRYAFRLGDKRDYTQFSVDYPLAPLERVIADDGSSYVSVQRWNHNLAKLAKQPPDVQQRWVGRDKQSGAPVLPLPPSSHYARVLPDLQRCRMHAMPCGELQHPGLLLAVYAAHPSVLKRIDERLVGTDVSLSDGRVVDAALNFAEVRRSQYFFIPSQQQLDALSAHIFANR
jgi:porphyrinogen peroxidase